MSSGASLLLIGEILVDVTLTPAGQETKLRLGGVTHAARALWAAGIPYSVAACIPSYLEEQARDYFSNIGCDKFYRLGEVVGSPNVILIGDPTEVSDQGYDLILRENKSININSELTKADLHKSLNVLAFPGAYDLNEVAELLNPEARLSIDIAYDIQSVDDLREIPCNLGTIFLSTSSILFNVETKNDLDKLVESFAEYNIDAFVLKENRGGVRVFTYNNEISVYSVGAQLGDTVNSVGVGDAFDAIYMANEHFGHREAALRATWASSSYAQTTWIDIFKRDIQRHSKLTLNELGSLKGVSVPWEERSLHKIYLAAPDFSNGERAAIDEALSALQYHNFKAVRPIKENGELERPAPYPVIHATYCKDIQLLEECDLVFAVPVEKDPGTLVEIGFAQARNIPVIVYDPTQCSANTMVIGGCVHYSTSLDQAINAVFQCFAISDKINE